MNILDELIDRFGNIPSEVENLIEIARIKQLCKKANVTKLMQKRENIVIYFGTAGMPMEKVNELIKKYRNKLRFSASGTPYVTYRLDVISDKNLTKEVKEFLFHLGTFPNGTKCPIS